MRIIPLTGSHDRQGLDCGQPELNDWLQRIARQHHEKGLSRTFVAVLEDDPTQVCAYYALTLTEVDTTALPETRRKKLPRMIPGVRLGRLAVDRRYQGKRLGELMLMDSMQRVRRILEHAGVVALFADAIDDTAARFYARYGFDEVFADDPLQLFLPVS